MRKHVVALILGAALSAWSTPAWATAFTLPGVGTSFGPTNGVSGSIAPVYDLTGTVTCLVGTCGTSASHDWYVFTVTLDGGSDPVDQIGVAVSGVSSLVGLGYLSGVGEVPAANPLPAPNSAAAQLATSSLGLFNYYFAEFDAANLQPTETTVRLFGAWTLGTLPGPGIPPPVPAGTVSFMIGEAVSTNFSVPGGVMTVVPEPGTLLLVGAGLLWLGFAGRRRRV